MKAKDIEIGQEYILTGSSKSRIGCSEEYFKAFKGKKVMALKNLNNYNNKNTVQISAVHEEPSGYSIITFWCSPYDLTEIKEV